MTEILSEQKTNTRKPATQRSYDGYLAYLLIVDVASRYTWIFLLKDKQPPIQIIDNFLQKYGTAKRRTNQTLITTSNDTTLQKSKQFKQLCHKRGYQTTTNEYIMDLNEYDAVSNHHTIRTDNGGELAGSRKFQQTIQNHGYTGETTAAGASFQNAIAKRPHRTLKEKVRCLLFNAGLGMEYWSSALIHAVWLYNRTYHKTIDKTPYP